MEGPSFETVTITTLQNVNLKIGLAICMDIDNKDFIDSSTFDLADFFISQQIDFIGNYFFQHGLIYISPLLHS